MALIKCTECGRKFKREEMQEGMYFDEKTKTLKFKLICEKCSKKLKGKKRKVELLCRHCKCKIIGEPFIQVSEGKPIPFCCKSCAISFLTLKCAHCGCLIVESPYVEVIGKHEHIFCCKSCSEAYKRELKDVALKYIG